MTSHLKPAPLRSFHRVAGVLAAAVALGLTSRAPADDWPEWMGPKRDGIWRETGLVERLDTNGPPIRWRIPVGSGYVGPAVANGRLYLVDRAATNPPPRARGDRSIPQLPGRERVLCLDAETGGTLWEHAYDCPYRISYPAGPRATPLVRDGRVFTLGAMGNLLCLDATTGQLTWSVDLPARYHCEPPVWGYAAHPLLDGNRLILPVGGTNSALVAFDAATGRELWRALHAPEIGYAPPVVCEVAGRRQVVFWHPDAISGVDPESGKVLWTHPYPVGGKPQRPEVAIAMPRFDADRVFITSFYQGSLLLRIPPAGDEPRVVWNRRSSKQSEMTEGLHTVMSTPWLNEGIIYGICAFGELRALDLRTGDRRWESLELFGGQGGFFAHAFIVPQGNRQWFWNDHGELLLGQLSPDGFKLLGRTRLLDTVESTRGRDVLWCHPAFAHRSLFVHNGRELIRASLAAKS